MQVTQETLPRTASGDAVVISPSGSVDMHESPKLRAVLLAEIAKKPAVVVVDLSAVSFIDSSGVATLVEALKATRAAGAALVLCGMNAKVKDVFELARLDQVFRIVCTRREALEGGA